MAANVWYGTGIEPLNAPDLGLAALSTTDRRGAEMLRKQLLLKSLIALAAICVTSSVVNAEIFVRPSAVGPSDHYRLVFVTSATRDGNLSDINALNQWVTDAANAIPELAALMGPGGVPITWTAIASNSGIDARVNTGTDGSLEDVAIYNLRDQRVADNNADLWNTTIQNPITRTETGVDIAQFVWTGSNTDGTYANAGFQNTWFGHSGSSDNTGYVPPGPGSWIKSGSTGWNPIPLNHIYAISSVVPEPSTLIMWTVLAGIGLAVLRRKRAAA